MNKIYHFVNGKEFKGTSQRTADVYNPAIGEVTAKVYLASKKDLDEVIQNSLKSFSWLG